MTLLTDSQQSLATYAVEDLRGGAVYRGYRPKHDVLAQVAQTLPSAHVVVVSGTWCGDCRREVPKFARIMESLPEGWSFELRGDDDHTRETLNVRAIPTFLVQDAPGGRELGRIVESPESEQGLEGDLLAIAQRARS